MSSDREMKAGRNAPTRLQPDAPTILIVDDSEAHRRLLAAYLQATEYTVREARNGQEAIAAIEQAVPALIFMDVEMPIMNGLEAITRIRLRYTANALPIVAMSSNTADEISVDLRIAGSNDFIPKPLDQAQIRALVRRYT